MSTNILYRYQLSYYIEEIEGADEGRFAVGMICREIRVVKETKRTFIIKPIYGNKEKRIYKGAKNTYAYETKEQALKNFYFRNLTYSNILKNKAKLIKELLKNIYEKNKEIILKE